MIWLVIKMSPFHFNQKSSLIYGVLKLKVMSIFMAESDNWESIASSIFLCKFFLYKFKEDDWSNDFFHKLQANRFHSRMYDQILFTNGLLMCVEMTQSSVRLYAHHIIKILIWMTKISRLFYQLISSISQIDPKNGWAQRNLRILLIESSSSSHLFLIDRFDENGFHSSSTSSR